MSLLETSSFDRNYQNVHRYIGIFFFFTVLGFFLKCSMEEIVHIVPMHPSCVDTLP